MDSDMYCCSLIVDDCWNNVDRRYPTDHHKYAIKKKGTEITSKEAILHKEIGGLLLFTLPVVVILIYFHYYDRWSK